MPILDFKSKSLIKDAIKNSNTRWYYDIGLFQIVILTNKYIKKLQTSLNYDDALNSLEVKAVNDKLALCPLWMVRSNRKTVTLIDTQPKGVKPASV